MLRLSLLSLGITRSRLGLKPSTFNLVRSYREFERRTLALHTLCPLPKLDLFSTQTRNFNADSQITQNAEGSESEALGKTVPILNRNKHGEQIISKLSAAPPYFVFVPAGDSLLTRRCRMRADGNIYAIYGARTGPWTNFPQQLCICVPKAAFSEAETDIRAFEQSRKDKPKIMEERREFREAKRKLRLEEMTAKDERRKIREERSREMWHGAQLPDDCTEDYSVRCASSHPCDAMMIRWGY